MFSTLSGNVRRNSLKDFTNIMVNGKIAMKLDEGDRLIRVRTCTEDDDVLLATRRGMCIRFPVSDVRLFSGRTSTGVRGVRLGGDDDVIWMSMLRHVEIATETRDAYLRQANALRRAEGEIEEPANEPDVPALATEQFEALATQEQFVLAATAKGFGKRTSAYDYRTTKRGGKGIVNVDTEKRGDTVVATFPVEPADQIMLVTDGGQVIRCPVDDVRIASRRTQGVNLFDVEGDAEVVSVARLRDVGGEDEDEDDEEEALESADEAAEDGDAATSTE
jgi:DNA gyrase subunit A